MAPFRPALFVASFVNAGAVVVRVASPPPVVVAGVVVVFEEEGEGVVLCAVVLLVAVPELVALDTDTVFVPPEPHPTRASTPAARASGGIQVRLTVVILAFIFVLTSRHPRMAQVISDC
jgi:hypothetical protein